jgi:competence ComEA-like helix-hairpin-helix protein
LLLIIITLQGIFFYIRLRPFNSENEKIIVNETEQKKIDSLKKLSQLKDSIKVFPFNPNFITDHKGYTLGMSVQEIDRLHTFRKLDKYVNSKEEFQKVTLVSDSLLNAISPYFKFPDWINTSKVVKSEPAPQKRDRNNGFVVKDINIVTAEELKTISGIGNKLSARIVKFRDRLGGFLVDEQLYDVYGLDAAVAEKALEKFKVLDPPKIEKININTASKQDIAKLVYISYGLANKIVAYRELNGDIKSFNELLKVDDFPSEKLDRIALYLLL